MKKFTFLLLLGIFSLSTAYSQVLPDNWTGDTGIDTYQESTTVHGDTYSCRIDVNTSTQGNCDFTNDVEISVTAGETYTVKFWAYTSEFVRITAVLVWDDGTTTYSGQYVGPNTGEWTEFTYSNTVPAGKTGVYLRIRCYDVSGFTPPETQYVDDFTFESPTGTSLTVTNGDMESWPTGTPPVIANITPTPQFPTSSESVSVSADATDDGSITDVELNWGATSGSLTNNITMSFTSGDTYTTDSDIPTQADGTTIYFEIVATDNNTNTTTSSEQQYLTHDAKTATIPYSEDFASGFGDIFPANVAGKNIWSASSGYASMNGFNGDNPEEDWLVVPGIDLDTYSDELLSFDTYWQYGSDDADNYLKLMYSINYTGEGDPTGADWTEITTWTKPPSATTWTSSGNIDISGISGTSVHFAFKYYSTGSPRGWRVDNISVIESAVDDPGSFDAATASSSQIDLSWTQNGNTDNVMVAWSSDGTFGTPSGPYNVGEDITGGGTVLFNGAGTSTSHNGLTANTQYYYMAWSVDGSSNYSNGVTDNATTLTDNTNLYFSEVADPSGTGSHDYRFVELVNSGSTEIDFSSDTWYLNKQSNGGSWSEVQLTGSVAAGGVFVIAVKEAEFITEYGFTPDQSSSVASSNGDDGYFLTVGGDYDNDGATIIDAYGVIDEDGTGTAWEFEDSKAVRLRTISSPNSTWTAIEWAIPGSASRDDMTPSEHKEDVSWAGAGTTADDWNEKGSNWSGTYGYIPDASFNVTVPSTTVSPVIYAQAVCNDLTVQATAFLDISVNQGLTAYGDLDVVSGGGFTVLSDATGNGSVIVKGTVSGSTDVKRYFQGYDDANNGWHYISSPVDNMTISGTEFDPTGTLDDLYRWDETGAIWDNYKNGGNPPDWDNFENGRGYLAAIKVSDTRAFEGVLNNADETKSNLSFTGDDGWHLLGNPFASALVWNTTNWLLTNVTGTCQVWDEDKPGYSVLNENDIIPSTNGFFVEVDNATNSMTIPASARVHDNTNNYKKSSLADMNETLGIKVTNDENNDYDYSRIGFREDATESWNIEFDAHKLFASATVSQIWTVSNEENFAQNYLPPVYESYQLPLHFRAGINSTHHINVSGIESFYDNSGIFLEDLFTNEIINLGEQQLYTFTATTEDSEDRFILHFYGVTSVDEPIATTGAQIYAAGKTVYIRFNNVSKDDSQVEVFNTLGQQVYNNELTPQSLSSFTLNEKPGIYIVRLRTENGLITQKVMIK